MTRLTDPGEGPEEFGAGPGPGEAGQRPGWGKDRLRVIALSVLAFSIGCANHVRFLDEQEERVDTSLLESEFGVVATDTKIRTSVLRVEFYRTDLFEDTTEQVTIKYEEATPYQALRELYEVPAGLVALPLALTANVLQGVLLLGDPAEDFTSWTFSALNPFMNTQNPERVTRTPIDSSESRRVMAEQRRVKRPASDMPAVAQYDNGDPAELRTDALGVTRFHLLDAVSPSMGPRPRRLVVSLVSPAGEGPSQEFFVSRDLARRLGLARRPMLVVLGPREDARALGEALFGLDRLGFGEFSVELEDELLKRDERDPEFVQEFRDALDALYDADPGSMSGRPTRPASALP